MQEVRGRQHTAAYTVDAVLSMCSNQVHHCCCHFCLYLLHHNLKAPSAHIAQRAPTPHANCCRQAACLQQRAAALAQWQVRCMW